MFASPGDGGNVSPLIAQLLQAIGQGPQFNTSGASGAAGQAPGNPLGTFPPNASVAAGPSPPVQAGAVGAAPGRGFVWGGRTWAPHEFNAFSNYLRSKGVDVAQWARAHPGAFASFNIDPRIKQVIASTMAPAQGGMGHA